jgi:hypothetical protein
MSDDEVDIRALVTSSAPVPRPQLVTAGPDVSVSVDIYFQVLGSGAPNEPSLDKEQELSPGSEYHVIVTLAKSASAPVAIGDAMSLHMEWQGGQAPMQISEGDDPVHTGLFETGQNIIRRFTIKVASGAAVTHGKLVITARGDARGTRRIGERAVRISGTKYKPEEGFFEAAQVVLPPPDDSAVAMLYLVQEDPDDNTMTATGFHSGTKPLTGYKFEAPDMSLAEDGVEPNRDVYNAVTMFGNNAIPSLLAWLHDVITNTQGNVVLVISEHGASHIPWEMIPLDDETPPLGARIPVTRWTRVLLGRKTIQMKLTEPEPKSGRVLNYVDRDLHYARLETDELELCDGETCANEKELRKKLGQPPDDLALLFLSCHGTFATDRTHKAALVSLKLSDRGLKLTPFNLAAMPRSKASPLVVVNACHSARVAWTRNMLLGLPNFFLAKYGSSYLGTLGEVAEDYAAALGRDLIKQALSEQGIDLACFIFEKRKEAWKKFDVAEDEKNYQQFVSAFLYVLYGPIKATMKLLPKKAKVN